jgi:hypothetical protein
MVSENSERVLPLVSSILIAMILLAVVVYGVLLPEPPVSNTAAKGWFVSSPSKFAGANCEFIIAGFIIGYSGFQ